MVYAYVRVTGIWNIRMDWRLGNGVDGHDCLRYPVCCVVKVGWVETGIFLQYRRVAVFFFSKQLYLKIDDLYCGFQTPS